MITSLLEATPLKPYLLYPGSTVTLKSPKNIALILLLRKNRLTCTSVNLDVGFTVAKAL
jgi:hypothetical protein